MRHFRRNFLAVQKVLRRNQLIIEFHISGHKRLRAMFFISAVEKMALERSLTLYGILADQIFGNRFENFILRLDALRLNRPPRRRVIAGGGQTQRTVILAKRNNCLHRALAERARADQRRPLVILQGTRNNFRSGSRAAIDQNHHGFAVRQIITGARIKPLGFVAMTTTR